MHTEESHEGAMMGVPQFEHKTVTQKVSVPLGMLFDARVVLRRSWLNRLLGRISPVKLPQFSYDEVYRFLQRDKQRFERLGIPNLVVEPQPKGAKE